MTDKLTGIERLHYAQAIITVARTLAAVNATLHCADLAKVIGLSGDPPRYARVTSLLRLAAATEKMASGKESDYARFVNWTGERSFAGSSRSLNMMACWGQ